MVDYTISEKMRYDKRQTLLTENGITGNDKSYAVRSNSYTIFDCRKVLCPFCLSYNQINKFLIMNTGKSTKNTINKLLGKCPNCQNSLQLITLDSLSSMSVHDFAFWVYEYRLNGFWSKVVRGHIKGSSEAEKYFKEWSKKANLLSDSVHDKMNFWDWYKIFKGDYDSNKDNDNGENE